MVLEINLESQYPLHHFLCTKFQGNQIMHLCLMANFNEKKEQEKNSQFLKVHISETPHMI